MFCPQCGYKNEDTSKFCQGCGNRLENGGKSAAQPKASPPPPTPPAGKPAQKNVAPPPPPPPPSVGAAPASTGAGFQSIPTPQPAAPSSQPKNTQFTGSPGLTCPVCGQPVAAGKSLNKEVGSGMGIFGGFKVETYKSDGKTISGSERLSITRGIMPAPGKW